MIVPGSITSLLFGVGRYLIQRAIIFVIQSPTQFLSRIFGAPTNKYKWTFSAWVRRGGAGSEQAIFSNSSNDQFRFDSSNCIRWLLNGGSSEIITTATYAGTSSYYHFVIVMDAAQADPTDRMQLYVNGSRVTSLSLSNFPSTTSPSTAFNTATGIHRIGDYSDTTKFGGRMAEINFVDGQALTPASFGETLGGAWVPKKYTGTYGANGFFLDFVDPTSTTTLGLDRSGNGNNWTFNNMTTGCSTTETPTS